MFWLFLSLSDGQLLTLPSSQTQQEKVPLAVTWSHLCVLQVPLKGAVTLSCVGPEEMLGHAQYSGMKVGMSLMEPSVVGTSDFIPQETPVEILK